MRPFRQHDTFLLSYAAVFKITFQERNFKDKADLTTHPLPETFRKPFKFSILQ